MTRARGVLSLLLVGACSERNPVATGTYTSPGPAASGVVLTIDAAKARVSFTVPGGAPVERVGAPRDPARWPTLCPRGMKDTSSEVVELGAEPLAVGDVRVERPALVANCLGKPEVELYSLDESGAPVKPPAAVFRR